MTAPNPSQDRPPQDRRPIAPALLAWYDRHARVLPWRVPPQSGERADPYRVWLSEVMLQQTTVAAVKDYFNRFIQRWPRVTDLAAADDDAVMAEWAGLGYYARARNLLACARAVTAAGGQFPQSRDGLLALPGIGPYTAAAVAAIAYDHPETVIDGNVERVIARFDAITTPLPTARPAIAAAAARETPTTRSGDYAQAMMDLGATICTPRNPACGICPLRPDCRGFALGLAPDLPAKRPKTAKPRRAGRIWIGVHGSSVLLERRSPKGLLGGTMAFPSDGWDKSAQDPPATGEWQKIGLISHVFTHFHAELDVCFARLASNPTRGTLTPLAGFSPEALPGLMRKAWDLAAPLIEGEQK